MALSPAFTVAQSVLDPELVIVTDTSSGSDLSISQRRIFFQTAFGTYLVEDGVLTDYNPWPLANVNQSFRVVDSDSAVSITTQWLTAGDVVVNTLTQVYALTENNKQFFFGLLQLQALSPQILGDKNYYASMAKYWMLITGAINAISIGADISASQAMLDQANDMIDNSTKYF